MEALLYVRQCPVTGHIAMNKTTKAPAFKEEETEKLNM